ncbi:LPXTG cell wall anchor domain-containing protein [Weissella confusa]
MSNKDFASGEGNYATWAPSYIVQINPDDTTTVLARATNQGDWVWDDSSRNDNMLGVLKEGAVNSVALPGEWGKPVDWSLINRSSGLGLKPHQPDQPKIGQPDQQPESYGLPGFKLPDNGGDKPAGKTSFDSKNSPVILGYTFKEVQGNPSQPSNATNNGVINTSTNTGSKVNNGAVNSPELPQTGANNSQSQTMSFIGILLAIFGSLLGFLGIKKRRND